MAPRRSACQICMDEPTAIAGSTALGGALCRPGCAARVCVSCLARHVEVSLSRCFAGVLPRVLCPSCRTPMGLDRWCLPLEGSYATARQASKLRAWHDELSAKACWMMPACCYQEDYTHLPEATHCHRPLGNPLALAPAAMAAFRRLAERFAEHQAEPRAVLALAVEHFGAADARALVERTLLHLADSERRARLLLALLHRFPDTRTRCCGQPMCFNCKRQEHHERCPELDKPADEATCLVRCRGCRLLLMKVEGCDTVYCVCGRFMLWSQELARKDPRAVEEADEEEERRRHRQRDSASLTSVSSVSSLVALWEDSGDD